MSATNEQTNLHNEQQLLQEIKSLENILQLKNVQLNLAIKNIEQNFGNMHENYRNMSNDLHNSWKYKYNQLYKQNNEIKQLIEQINIQQKKSNKQTQIKNGKTAADKQTELTDENLQQIHPKNVIDDKEHKSNTDKIKSTPKIQKNITKKKGKKKSKKSNKQKQNKSEIVNTNININENESELWKTFELFENKIGNKPATFMQFFNFIKQENINFKYGQVKKWWENNHNVGQKSITKTKTKTKTINKPPIIKRSRSKRRNGDLLLYNRN
eukprot:482060_1